MFFSISLSNGDTKWQPLPIDVSSSIISHFPLSFINVFLPLLPTPPRLPTTFLSQSTRPISAVFVPFCISNRTPPISSFTPNFSPVISTSHTNSSSRYATLSLSHGVPFIDSSNSPKLTPISLTRLSLSTS